MVVFTSSSGGCSPRRRTACPTRSSPSRRWSRGRSSRRLTRAANSLVDDPNLISKVYFPRLLLPLAAVAVGLVDFAHRARRPRRHDGRTTASRRGRGPDCSRRSSLLAARHGACGVALWLAALNVRYRDVRHVVPFLIQVWLFATPVAYSGEPRAGAVAAAVRAEPDGRASSTGSAGRSWARTAHARRHAGRLGGCRRGRSCVGGLALLPARGAHLRRRHLSR